MSASPQDTSEDTLKYAENTSCPFWWFLGGLEDTQNWVVKLLKIKFLQISELVLGHEDYIRGKGNKSPCSLYPHIFGYLTAYARYPYEDRELLPSLSCGSAQSLQKSAYT